MALVSNKTTTKTDKLIGQRIRDMRLSKGLSQTQLGAQLGVTFQQIQKYENGANRVGSGRLYQIAEFLDVPVTTFFESEKRARTAHLSPFALLNDPMALQVLKEFSKLHDHGQRRLVLTLVERISSAGKK